MIVVSDTTCLTTLLKAGMQDLLIGLFEEVCVPPAVFDELAAFHPRIPSFVRVVPLEDTQTIVPNTLGRGETEAIKLAKVLKADLLLSDDRKARAVAKELGITCRGVLGLLLAAKHRGLIASVRDAIRRVETQGGLYLSEGVKTEAIRLAGE
jgi:predicted nucleic acid-binding protein